MAYFKGVNNSYDLENTVYDLCNYVIDKQKTSGYIGGRGVYPSMAVLQMQTVQAVWGKNSGRRMRHYILGFADYEGVTYDQAHDIGFAVAGYFFPGYQIIYGVHITQAHLHIHFAMNTVSYLNGKKFSGGIGEYLKLLNYVGETLAKYGLQLIQLDDAL